MKCEDFQERLADYLAGSLGESAGAEFHSHMAECAACRADAEHLRKTWGLLGAVEVEPPSAAMRERFYQSLSAYKQGLEGARHTGPKPARGLFDWLPRPLGWQVAWSAAVLLVGFAAGHLFTAQRNDATEIARLHQEVGSMRQMVALSLMQQQSASERLRGVDWTMQAGAADPQVLSALLTAVSHDPNVNVRLAAVDALRRFAANPTVSQGIDRALPRQDSPLVQIAMIDLLVDRRDPAAGPSLEALVRNASVNQEVKERAQWALRQLK